MGIKFSVTAAVFAVAAIGALAACGGTTTSGGSSAPAGQGSTPGSSSAASSSVGAGTGQAACSLVSQADAVSMTGDSSIANVEGAGGSGVAGLNLCDYSDTGSGSGSGSEVVVLTEAAPAVSASILQAVLAEEATSGSGAYQSVSGIGDAAYSETEANQGDLVFVKGSTLVVIIASSPTKSGADMLSAVEQEAKSVAGKL